MINEDLLDLALAERHIPPALGRIVDGLSREASSARFQSASDLDCPRRTVGTMGSTDTLAGVTGSPGRRDRFAWGVAGVTSLGLIVALSLAAFLSPTRQPIEGRENDPALHRAPEGWQSATGDIAGTARDPLVISPDGRRLAMIARRAGGPESILIRLLDSQTVQPWPARRERSTSSGLPTAASSGSLPAPS